MSTNHPYPKAIVRAVQAQMDWAGSTAEVALQALWDASRVDSYKALAEVPSGTVIIDGGGFFGMKIRPGLWTEFFDDDHMHTSESSFFVPAHILHWGEGDTNDR